MERRDGRRVGTNAELSTNNRTYANANDDWHPFKVWRTRVLRSNQNQKQELIESLDKAS